MLFFALAIIALLFWSGSDLFSKIGSRPEDKYSHWEMVMAVGLIMGLHALYEIVFQGIAVTLPDFIAYMPAIVCYIASMTLGYIGLRYIELSVSSPICNASGALAWILCVIFLPGTATDVTTVAGVVLVCVGVVLLGVVEYREDEASRMLRQEKAPVKYVFSPLALALPLLYCLLDAAGTFADTLILEGENGLPEEVANVAYELMFFAVGVCAFVYVVIIKKSPLKLRRDGWKLLGGVCETAGQFAYIYVIGSDFKAGIPIISAYCAVSVLWSRIFLKERLTWKHYLTIGIVILGIVILGIAEAMGEA